MRILLPRFDTHGDLILLEGFVEALLARYTGSSVTLLVRRGYDQLATLFPPGVRWHTVALRPYEPVVAGDGQLARLRRYFSEHEYDLILGTCFTQTWADAAVAALANPGAQRIALCGAGGPRQIPQAVSRLLRSGRDGDHRLWDRTVVVDEHSDECTKYQVFWEALAGNGNGAGGFSHAAEQGGLDGDAKVPPPQLRIPSGIDAEGQALLKQAGLVSGSYVCCCPTGTTNTPIKAWPGDRFAEIVAWLEQVHRLPTLLVGHDRERALLESVRALAAACGAQPRLWIGRDGQLPLLAAVTRLARLYLGNDTAPMHLAAALNVPAVAIFGGGTWPRFVPRTNTVGLVRELLCFNCDWKCLFADALCVKLVRTGDVRRAVNLALGELASPQGEMPPPPWRADHAAMDRVRRPSRIIRLETPLEVEPMTVWLGKAQARAAAQARPSRARVFGAITHRLRTLFDA